MSATWSRAQAFATVVVEGAWPPPLGASFEWRAAHDVLALTSLFTSAERPQSHWLDHLHAVHDSVDDDLEWALWCSTSLARARAQLSALDLAAAGAAWGWLTRSRLLSGELSRVAYEYAETAGLPGAGVNIGVPLARRAATQALRHTVLEHRYPAWWQ